MIRVKFINTYHNLIKNNILGNSYYQILKFNFNSGSCQGASDLLYVCDEIIRTHTNCFHFQSHSKIEQLFELKGMCNHN